MTDVGFAIGREPDRRSERPAPGGLPTSRYSRSQSSKKLDARRNAELCG
jgi:hypothetical protein